MIRLLHTADWQIGRQVQRFQPEDAAALAEARFSVVERIAGHAAQGRFDAVLVAGDVFDAQTVSDRSIRRLFNALSAYDGPWVMIPGNHDAALAQSVWTRARQLQAVPANVHLALAPEPVVIAAARLAVLPAPLTQRHTHADLTAWFDHADTPDGYFRIGLAHGSVTGILADHIDSPNPIAAERADSARLDYLALGDWHGWRRIDERCWYSGTPETDRFRNNESGYILDVEIEAPGAPPRVTPTAMGQYDWQSWSLTLDVPSDVDDLLQRLDGLSSRHVLELALSGLVDLAGQRRLEQGLGRAQARLRALEWDSADLRVQPNDEDLAALQLDGYVAEVLQSLRTLQQDDDPQARVARDALVLLAALVNDGA